MPISPSTSPSGVPFEICGNPGEVAAAAAEFFATMAVEAIARRGSFAVALSGGSTPRLMHDHLTREPLASRIGWSRAELFFGDERAVGPDHADSNYRMARETLFDRVAIPPSQIHRMIGEAADLAASARDYASILQSQLPLCATGFPTFDLILLGMGPDGHTASLFPGTEALDETRLWVVANDVPQLQTRRLTLTFPVLNAAKNVLFLVTGQAKAAPVAEIFSTERGRAHHPAGRVRPTEGRLLWLLDREAAAGLPEVSL